MGYLSLRTLPFLLALPFALLTTQRSNAQEPDSVDIDLRQSTGDGNTLEVYIRSNGQPFGDVLSGLTFTIRWATTSPATLGPRVNTCPAGISIAPTAQVTDPLVDDVPTGFNYRSYNAFGTSLLTDEGYPLPQDTWYLVMTLPVENNTGCTEFNIVNDNFTSSPGNARDFYVSLGGVDKTGSIEPASAFIGTCAADCLGNVGGPALPGTPCDDGNPDTENDLYTAECLCEGLPLGLAPNANNTFSVWPNPTTGLVYLSGLGGNTAAAAVRVSDALGRSLRTPVTRSLGDAAVWSVDLSGMPSGVYLIETDRDGARHVERIVKR